MLEKWLPLQVLNFFDFRKDQEPNHRSSVVNSDVVVGGNKIDVSQLIPHLSLKQILSIFSIKVYMIVWTNKKTS